MILYVYGVCKTCGGPVYCEQIDTCKQPNRLDKALEELVAKDLPFYVRQDQYAVGDQLAHYSWCKSRRPTPEARYQAPKYRTWRYAEIAVGSVVVGLDLAGPLESAIITAKRQDDVGVKVMLEGFWYSPEILLEHWMQGDGKRCGVLE